MRVTKKHKERLNEILDAAQVLFVQKGYENTTVNDILNAVDIGKGTFYHYFKSKEEVMNAVITRIMNWIVDDAKKILLDSKLNAQEKMQGMITAMNISGNPEGELIDELHNPTSAQMHQLTMIETIKACAPLLAEAVKQGIEEGIYKTDYPLESAELILSASQFVFDPVLFKWAPEELASRISAFTRMIELTLDAPKGSYDFIGELHFRTED